MGDRKPDREARTLGPAEVARTLRSALTLQVVAKPPRVPLDRAPTEPPPPNPQPTARYLFMNEIGRGGMGRVDEVFDGMLGRSIAQKCALPDGGDTYATMLVSEAQTCAQLEHPAIVPVYDIGVAPDGSPYYTMRKVRGRTFYDALRDVDKPATRAQLLAVLRQVCLAVDYAHSRGVVHRDLKPENVIVGEFGEVYVLDWGIAALLEGSDVKRALKDSFSAGSPGYMAPEQIKGEGVDARTDVFALGAMLYEALSGLRLFQDEDHASLVRRATTEEAPSTYVPPGVLGSSHLEALVRSCIETDPNRRPGSARFIADSIDEHLDGERARAEREREADALVMEGDTVYQSFLALDAESKRFARGAEDELLKIAPWEPAEKKQSAWDKQAKSRHVASAAARMLARVETAFLRAIGRVEDHAGARAGLARLHFRQFEDAEAAADAERMAQHLDLARVYDDGELALELRNVGELVVEPTEDVQLTVALYEARGPLLVLVEEHGFAPRELVTLQVGSYLVRARTKDGRQIRYPLMIRRAVRQYLKLRVPAPNEVPDGMVLIPGGPFLMPLSSNSSRMHELTVRDFAIGEFPVTLREYAEFLDAIGDPVERQRRCGTGDLVKDGGKWQLSPSAVEGEARKRIPRERELDLPISEVSWYDTMAYARWRTEKTRRRFRLPTNMEWDKAMRGADGRAEPMGGMDPAFAKRRESRPEATQPEPIGAFDYDESPCGVRDLGGGVADWTCTPATRGVELDVSDEGTEKADERQVVIRGGTWSYTALNRVVPLSQMLFHRTGWVGFRLALSLDEHGSSELIREPMKRTNG